MNRRLRTVLLHALLIVMTFALIGGLTNFLRADGIPLIKKMSVSNIEGIKRIGLGEARKLYDRNSLFVDARTPEEFEQGHIKNALNLPYEQYEEKFPEVLENISPETPIITYCSGEECNSSDILANQMKEDGFTTLYNFYGGWPDWVAADYPMDKKSQAPLYSVD